MKVKRYQDTGERSVLTAMIVHDEVLDKVARSLRGDKRPFQSKWANVIAKWCLDYWERYKEAPNGEVKALFVEWAKTSRDEAATELVEAFLEDLSSDYEASREDINPQVLIDRASNLFTKIRLSKTIKQVGEQLEANNVTEADETFRSYEKVEFTAGRDTDPFDPDQQREALAKRDVEALIKWPGDLGEFLDGAFERDSFISFAGPEKRGKSYWLMETMWRALLQRRRVLYYVVGDMSEHQMLRRLYCRATMRPLRTEEIAKPDKIVKKKDKEARVLSTVTERKGVTSSIVEKRMNEVLVKTGTKKPRLRTKVFESSTICAGDIEMHIADLVKEDWMPDVVVIDYADILTAEPHAKHMEYRHQLNETWKTLRRISQRFHLCLVTATQTAATSYDAVTIRKSDFSEDKRKAAHVTGMIGINQTSMEKTQGIFRLNWIFQREGHWAEHQVVYVAGNLKIAHPCIISSLL